MMGTEHRNHIHREKTRREKERKRAHTLMGIGGEIKTWIESKWRMKQSKEMKRNEEKNLKSKPKPSKIKDQESKSHPQPLMVRRLMVRILIPSPLRHRLRKREIQILQPRLERLNRIPIRRMSIDFTRCIL